MKRWLKTTITVICVLAVVAVACLLAWNRMMSEKLMDSRQIADHLYEVEYDVWDQDWADEIAEAISKTTWLEEEEAEAEAEASQSPSDSKQQKNATSESANSRTRNRANNQSNAFPRYSDSPLGEPTRQGEGKARPRNTVQMMHALQDYFDQTTSALCTSCRVDDITGRNFDWAYDDLDEFIVRVPAAEGRHASIGVANAFLPEILQDATALASILPALTMDGINDAGVSINVNVVDNGGYGDTIGTNPGGKRLCTGFVVRYVLDNASSAKEAVELLNECDIFSVVSQEFHWMISDLTETYIVECVDNKLCVLRKVAAEGNTTMSNFAVSNSPYVGDYEIVQGEELTSHMFSSSAIGVERYRMIASDLNTIDSQKEMIDHMELAWYSQMYEPGNERAWWSEMNGYESSSSAVPEHTFSYYDGPEWDDLRMEEFAIERETREEVLQVEARTGLRLSEDQVVNDVEHSTHTSSYDLVNRTLMLEVQERQTPFVFSLDQDSTAVSTPVYVNGENVGIATECNEEGKEWIYDAQTKTLTLLGESLYGVEGLDDSGITVVGEEKMGCVVEVSLDRSRSIIVEANGEQVAGKHGAYVVPQDSLVRVSYIFSNGYRIVMEYMATKDAGFLQNGRIVECRL